MMDARDSVSLESGNSTTTNIKAIPSTNGEVTVVQPVAQMTVMSPYNEQGIYTPPVGRWKDDLCNCCSNMWPSCLCVSMGSYFGGCLPIWLAGQISTRIGFISTQTLILAYVILFIGFWIIAVVITASTTPGNGQGGAVLLYYFPCFAALIFLIVLRVKFVEKFLIAESPMLSCCIGFWCGPCSLCQMARHLYGYTEVCDGDSLLDGSMRYDKAAVRHLLPPTNLNFDINHRKPEGTQNNNANNSKINNSNNNNGTATTSPMAQNSNPMYASSGISNL